jgi:hypothetical protein
VQGLSFQSQAVPYGNPAVSNPQCHYDVETAVFPLKYAEGQMQQNK